MTPEDIRPTVAVWIVSTFEVHKGVILERKDFANAVGAYVANANLQRGYWYGRQHLVKRDPNDKEEKDKPLPTHPYYGVQ